MQSAVLAIIDAVAAVVLLVAGPLLKLVARARDRMPLSRRALDASGVSAVGHHYYEPVVLPRDLGRSLREPRSLPGIDLDVANQLKFVGEFNYASELLALPREKATATTFGYRNGSFESGDSELLYDIVRHLKPARILEVGCGNSTLMIREALAKNRAEDASFACHHQCIEPYEQPWMEGLGIDVIRERVERCDPALFDGLKGGDILFIDSSHVSRPQGDVNYLFLTILPALAPGVLVHVHDIFTPRDYLDAIVIKDRKMWNEQYLLEALLSGSHGFRVEAALNMLYHDHRQALARACPVLLEDTTREPGSFWLRVLDRAEVQA